MLCSVLGWLGPVWLALVQAVAPLLVVVARRVAPLLAPVGLALVRRAPVRRVVLMLAPPG
jgi:hypothetical protein